MSGGQESFPPGSGPQPPFVPTQEDPKKPVGPDPKVLVPAPEGTETARHAQLFAYDAITGLFKPLMWVSGKLSVDATITIPPLTIDWIDQYFTVIQTHITRDVNGLVSAIAETDGVRTKNTTFTRDVDGRVTDIGEVVV